jgi:Domain of unknown function (DUF4062)
VIPVPVDQSSDQPVILTPDQRIRVFARDVYRAYLDRSQIFIGVYGESYGWVAPGERLSGLEETRCR